MAFCGFKLSLCILVLSVWGLVQLLMMGVLFYTESAALLEDLPLDGPYETKEQFLTAVHGGYLNNAYNCLIAACLYIVTLGVSAWQFYLNQKAS